MTPLEINVLLHIHCVAEPIENLGSHSSAQRDAVTWFKTEGLIQSDTESGCAYSLTDRGRAYVQFLMAMPLPVAKWTIPQC